MQILSFFKLSFLCCRSERENKEKNEDWQGCRLVRSSCIDDRQVTDSFTSCITDCTRCQTERVVIQQQRTPSRFRAFDSSLHCGCSIQLHYADVHVYRFLRLSLSIVSHACLSSFCFIFYLLLSSSFIFSIH